MSQYYEELVSQFTDVTGVDNEQARFYLESAAWQLEVALMSFYENENDERQQNSTNENDNDNEDNEIQEITASDSASKSQASKQNSTLSKGGITNSRFATISSLQKDTSSDEEEGQAFYAGGSEHSGQQVLGPGKKKNNIVAEMFKSAQEHGAEVIDPHQPATSKKKNAFTGVGYRLGQSSNDSEAISTQSSTPSSSNPEVNVSLKMWRDGLSVNDGPLRRYSDPDTQAFLSVIVRGVIPDELLKEAKGSEVHLNMEDHSHEDYVPTKAKVKAFSGKGNVLGSPAPATVMDPTSTSDQDRTSNEVKARELLAVNPAEPTTTIQIRLADGSRLAATLNHTHTIGDLRRFIKTARPEYCDKGFNLLTTFPIKQLDDDKTLVDAGILNSAIMQRLT